MIKHKKLLWLEIFGAIVFIFLAVSLFGLMKIAQIAKSLPNPQQFIDSRQVSQSSKIYDRTGEVLLYEIYDEEKRTVIPFKEIPDYAKNATIAIEDKNFYSHQAFDWRAIIRAFIVNIQKGRVVQGGSTITQQLAKNAFLSSEQTINRKLKELILAYWIEKYYSKDEILNLYLNQISYGSNAYGIEAASQAFFSKSAKDLNLAESALLAALPKAPTYYSPWGTHSNELMQRKDYVLKQMLELNFIDSEEYERAKLFAFQFSGQRIGKIKAPHFVMMVKDYLANKYGEEFLKKGGFKIITTLDWETQQIAEKVVKEGADRNEELYKGNNAALVAQNPKTGEVLALVGSRDYFDTKNEGNFNVAAQGLRQPGSAFKPFGYITAFKKGLTLDTIVFDLATEFVPNNQKCPLLVDFNNDNNECYHPENFDHKFRGPISLRESLAQSINVPAVKILYIAGLENTIKTAKSFGITTLGDSSLYGLSLVLGGGEVKLIDLVNAYSVFSQDGVKHNQKIVLKIEDESNDIIESVFDQATQVIEPKYAQMINDILSDNEARKPLYSGSYNLTVFNDRQVALKTGTTNDYRDAWTIGYTPYLTVGVWAGNNHQEPMQKNAGSILAALPIWNAFMKEVLNKYPIETFNNQYISKIENNNFIDTSTSTAELIESNEGELKPMLNGNYISSNGEIHNILHYIDKNNVLGATPQNPQNDSQYPNWEFPVQLWLQSLPG